MRARIVGHSVRLTDGVLEQHMARTRRECPYCGQEYWLDEDTKHLNTRECLRAQKALRRQLDAEEERL